MTLWVWRIEAILASADFVWRGETYGEFNTFVHFIVLVCFSCVLVLHLICDGFDLVSHFKLTSCHIFVFGVFAMLVVLEPGPVLRCGPAVGLFVVQH